MPPRKVTSANPDVAGPSDPTIEATAASVDSFPGPRENDGDTRSAGPSNQDIDMPGPSSMYMAPQTSPARARSPPLPRNLTRAIDADSDDSDDEILAELPIYLSPALHPNLNLFQYPLQLRSIRAPTWAADRGKTITARVKEGAGRVEVEVPIDAGAEVWRDEMAKELGYVQDLGGEDEVVGGFGMAGAGAADDKKKSKKKKAEKWGDKMRLRSEVVPGTTGYYAGMIHEGV
jgi:DNA-directed RNA polymerase-3 subunit RPC5